MATDSFHHSHRQRAPEVFSRTRKVGDAWCRRHWIAAVLLLAVFVWSQAPTLGLLVRGLSRNADISSGQLVPFAAMYLAWCDRRRLAAVPVRPCWYGSIVLLMGIVVRMCGLELMYRSIEQYAVLLTLAGTFLTVFGWPLFWRSKWIILFLFFAIPVPFGLLNLIAGPLQTLAASGAVATLELMGVSVTQDRNILVLNDHTPIAVAEACSGLRMLAAFVMVAYFMACIANRPAWQKVVLVLSSVPVAIFCNLVRLVVTALLFLVVDSRLAESFFHDFAGWTMMPMAILILMGELWFMHRVLVTDQHGRPPAT